MSFSADVRANLLDISNSLKHDCCKRATLYGILYAARMFSREHIRFITSNEELSALTVKLLDSLYHIKANLYISEKKSQNTGRQSYKITVAQKKELELLFDKLRYRDDIPEYSVNEEMFKCPNCKMAFLRGIFLSCGTVSDPEKSYHLEMSFPTKDACKAVTEIFISLGAEPKTVQREKEFIVYFKNHEDISGFLGSLGASNAAFAILNKKIEREYLCNANRMRNGDMANIGKTVAAASEQINAIALLVKSGKFNELPEELQITAQIRVSNPDSPLSELAALHQPPITKSGVNHRLKKIMTFIKSGE